MSFIPVQHNFQIQRGGTWRYRFQWVAKTSNSILPKDLTEFTGTMPILPVGSTIPWMTLSSNLTEDGSGIIFNSTTGLIDLVIAAVDTEAITWKLAAFGLKIVQPAPPDTIPLMVGKFSTRGPL